jgi:hypothetical protein
VLSPPSESINSGDDDAISHLIATPKTLSLPGREKDLFVVKAKKGFDHEEIFSSTSYITSTSHHHPFTPRL